MAHTCNSAGKSKIRGQAELHRETLSERERESKMKSGGETWGTPILCLKHMCCQEASTLVRKALFWEKKNLL
jgi:hypothetical protein